ncbi:hypothetical protein [Paenisporosarcina sp. OV554]|uniref:hypothetical protein n=1 Tax=Paenisporosarcina sp. OV554 TaxID=2135694 RepID=UPI000D3360D4|nr:hypothetical protein [Paenisporosarcina sp. OV554]PUB03972.1 hypothetical protein C8K15_1556 [Paenisporosarcina sp. OV554]
MFKISTFLVEYCNGDERQTSLDDSLKLREIFEHRKFTPEYIQMHIMIQYNDQIVVGNIPSGLDLWEQTYIHAVEGYLDKRKVEIMYGIDPYILKLISINSNLLEFSIEGEWEPVEVFAQAILPEREFLDAILDGAEHFWKVLLEFKVFEEKKLRESTPSDYPVQMIKEIKELRERVKLLN